MLTEVLERDWKTNKVLIFSKMSKPKPSIVYETYWRFAAERQRIFFKRFNGVPYPWTADTILDKHKFTNVYRATDRVSQYLIKKIIYTGNQETEEIFFRILLFKLFNKISTWEYIENEFGEISYKKYSFKKYNELLGSLMENKVAIYSAAYIMASGRTAFGWPKKYQNHLKLIEKMMADNLPLLLQQTTTMEEGYKLLLSYPTIGEFLAYQYITDLNYSNITDYSEMEFVKAGPGAKNGIIKCFESLGSYSLEDIIKLMSDVQAQEFEKYELEFNYLGNRSLQLIDCQNIFCEVDKYSRVAHPNIKGYTPRVRIKQKYLMEDKEPINYYFPPKWKVNL